MIIQDSDGREGGDSDDKEYEIDKENKNPLSNLTPQRKTKNKR